MPDKKPTHDLSDDQRAELQRFAQSLQERKRNHTQALDETDREEMLRFTEALRRDADDPTPGTGATADRPADRHPAPAAKRPTPPPPVRRDPPTIPVPDLPDLSEVVAAARPDLAPVGAHPTLDRTSTDHAPRRWTPPARSAVPVTDTRSSSPDPSRRWKLVAGVLAAALIGLLAFVVFDAGADEPDDPTTTTVPGSTATETGAVETESVESEVGDG